MNNIETSGLSQNEIGKLLQATIRHNPNHISSDMGDEKVILSIENSKYYNLGLMGSLIWEHMKEPIQFSALISLLTEIYDVDRPTCEVQLLPFINHLHSENLIHIQY